MRAASSCGPASLFVFEALSASTISRLKDAWSEELNEWKQRSLKGKEYVYLWVDGIHFGARMEDASQCMLVIIGATKSGEKELLTIVDGYRESEQSWLEALNELKRLGLKKAPKVAVEKAFDHFIKSYEAKYPKAAECLAKDRDALLTFYDFPAEHWIHLRTTNPIESTFATVRLRTAKTRGTLTRDTMMTMVFELSMSAQSVGVV
jgi:putative transposase